MIFNLVRKVAFMRWLCGIGLSASAMFVSTSEAKSDLVKMFIGSDGSSWPVYHYSGDTLDNFEGVSLSRNFLKIGFHFFGPGWAQVSFYSENGQICEGSFYYENSTSGSAGRPSRMNGKYIPVEDGEECPRAGQIRLLSLNEGETFSDPDPVVKELLFGLTELDSDDISDAIVGQLVLEEVSSSSGFDKTRPCLHALWSGYGMSLPELYSCNPTRLIALLENGVIIPFFMGSATVTYENGQVSANIEDSYIDAVRPNIVRCNFGDISPSDIPAHTDSVEATILSITQDEIVLSCRPVEPPA